MSSLRLLLSDSHDPLFNLAVEECIFRQMDPNQRVLFLWRNANTVVIGRAQAVNVTLRGQPFDLKPHTQVTVARFEVKE